MKKEIMDKLFDNIYKKFFLRDVVSIFICGFLVFLALLMRYGEQIKQIRDIALNPIVRKILMNKDNELSLFSYGLLIGLSYALGLIINWLRDYAQFRWCYNWCCITPQKSKYSENVEDYRKKIKEFEKASKDTPNMADDFERMIVMFQVTGNFALTIILCIISIWDLLLFEFTMFFVIIIALICSAIALTCFSIFKFKEHITYLEKYS